MEFRFLIQKFGFLYFSWSEINGLLKIKNMVANFLRFWKFYSLPSRELFCFDFFRFDQQKLFGPSSVVILRTVSLSAKAGVGNRRLASHIWLFWRLHMARSQNLNYKKKVSLVTHLRMRMRELATRKPVTTLQFKLVVVYGSHGITFKNMWWLWLSQPKRFPTPELKHVHQKKRLINNLASFRALE